MVGDRVIVKSHEDEHMPFMLCPIIHTESLKQVLSSSDHREMLMH